MSECPSTPQKAQGGLHSSSSSLHENSENMMVFSRNCPYFASLEEESPCCLREVKNPHLEPNFLQKKSLHLLGVGQQTLLTPRYMWRPLVSEEENKENVWERGGKLSWVQTISNFLQLEDGLLFQKSHHEDTWTQHVLRQRLDQDIRADPNFATHS